MVRRARNPPYNSRSTNPRWENEVGFPSKLPQHSHLCLFSHSKLWISFIENKCVDFSEILLPHFAQSPWNVSFFFFKFSPPARVSKLSLDCNIFLFNDKVKEPSFAVFWGFFYQGCMKNQVFFSCKYVTKNSYYYRASLVLTSDEWSWDYLCGCFPSCVDGPATLKTPESPQCSFAPKSAHMYLQLLPSMLHRLLRPSYLPLIMTANPFFHSVIYVLFIHKTV